jgi:4-hydroxy-3-methylbut-2-enyl diphosphate reductase
VLGLVGQTEGTAIVVENFIMMQEMIENGTIRLDAPTMVFSQTTKSPAEYAHVCASLLEKMAKTNGMTVENFKNSGRLLIHNTICSQVASRHQKLTKFALQHDIIIFVSGKASSNGKVLCDLCKSLNIRTYHITSASEIKRDWFRADDSVGVCGATSTPKWLLEEVANEILALNKYVPDWEKTYGEKSTDNQ